MSERFRLDRPLRLPEPPRTAPVFTDTGIIGRRTSHDRPVIEISATARDTIITLAAEACYIETGGGLYTTTPLNRGISIDTAGVPGRTFKRRRYSISFDPVEVDEAADGLIGLWHSHPSGGVSPSPADLGCCQRMRSNSRRPIHKFACLICGPHPADAGVDTRRGWKKPQLAAWIIGADYYERADVVTTAPKPRPARLTGWVVATCTFTTTYDGQPVQITAGRDRMDASHPIVLANPGSFKADTSRRTPNPRDARR